MLKALKALNLYAGLGGNRQLWKDVDVTAVENNKDVADIYRDFYPNDLVIIGDAHNFLLKNYSQFDFIWSSPPCQTHSQIRYNIGFKANRKYKKVVAVYPNMELYQEIILLRYYFAGKWVVENTVPYYEPLIKGNKTAGHIFWSNFIIDKFDAGNRNHRGGTVESLQKRKGIDISSYNIKNKRQLLRNCVEPETGLYILNKARNIKQSKRIGFFDVEI